MLKNTGNDARNALSVPHFKQQTSTPIPNSEHATTSSSSCRSPQRFSSDCLTQIGKSIVKNKSKATEMTVNGSMLDTRIYTDVQSNGLAGRIVKYQETEPRLRRSLSNSSVYKRPGHFPLVHLKKTEIPCAVKRKSLSMTRISPPEKSLFYGNTLSSLLRSNSIVSLQKSDEELSSENRPIIHPPPTNETVPTRSVLDVLKEISRKRINSGEEEDNTDFNVKKYCSRDAKSVGTAKPNMQAAYRSPTYVQKQHSNYFPSKAQHETPRTHLPPIAQSPTKRNNNNDISSSLSSSLLYANKRKLYDTPSKQTSPQAGITPVARMQYQEGKRIKYDMPQLEQARVKEPYIAPASMQQTTQPQSASKRLTLFNKYAEDVESANEENGKDLENDDGACAGVQFIKPKKGNLLSGAKHPIIQRTIKSKLALMLSGLRGELYQGEDEADEATTKTAITTPETTTTSMVTPLIPITPIASKPLANEAQVTIPTTVTTTSSATKLLPIKNNFLVPKTAENKDLIVLSPIVKTSTAGSINFQAPKANVDMVDNQATNKDTAVAFGNKPDVIVKPFSFGTTASVENNVKLTTIPTEAPKSTTTTSSANMLATTTTTAFGVPATTNVAPSTTLQFPKSFATNNFTFGQTNTSTIVPSATTAEQPKTTFAFGESKINNNSAKTEVVQSLNFSFDGNKTNEKSANSEPTKSAFSFGGNKTTSDNNSVNIEAPKSAFSFGANTTTNNNNNVNNEPTKPSFSFGGNTLNNSTNNHNTEQTKSAFSFGGNTTTNSNNNVNNEPTKPAFSFGGNTMNNSTTNNSNVKTDPQKSAFSFGENNMSSNSTSNTEQTKSAFSFGGTNNNSGQTEVAKSTFSFGQNATNNNSQNEVAKSAFSFGGNSNNNGQSEVPKSTFSFGGNTTNNNNSAQTDASKSTFSFGGNATNNNSGQTDAPKSTFNFGENKNNNASFSFNAPAPAPATTNSSASFSFNAPKSATITTNKPGFTFGSTNNSSFASNSLNMKTPADNTNTNNFNFNSPKAAAIKPFSSNASSTNNIFAAANDAGSTALSAKNLFGSVAASTPANSKAASFNFSPPSSTNANSTTFTPINMFAPNSATTTEPTSNLFAPPVQSAAGERPIRRATRRLNRQ